MPRINPRNSGPLLKPSDSVPGFGFVPAALRRLDADRAGPLARNRVYNEGYQRIAHGMQQVIEPGFSVAERSKVLPNWFAMGAHASPVVGRGILAAERGQAVLAHLRQGGLTEVAQKALYPKASDRAKLGRWAKAFDQWGLSASNAWAAAAVLDVVVRSNNYGKAAGMKDPRVQAAVVARFRQALGPGGLVGDDVGARLGHVLGTFEALLAQGNKAIFSDIAAAGDLYLSVRQTAGRALTKEEIFSQVPLEGATPLGSNAAYDFAKAHLNSAYDALWFDREVPNAHSNDLMLAAFALFEDAARATHLDEKNKLIAMGNSLIAWREQKVVVQPAFEGQGIGGVVRDDVMSIVSPLITIEFGAGVTWSAAEAARDVFESDGKPWTARSTEYQWGRFDDRWPLIVSGFRRAYEVPRAVWSMPEPDVRLH